MRSNPLYVLEAIDELVTTDDTTTIIFCAYQREATSRRDATWRIDLGRVILQTIGTSVLFFRNGDTVLRSTSIQ